MACHERQAAGLLLITRWAVSQRLHVTATAGVGGSPCHLVSQPDQHHPAAEMSAKLSEPPATLQHPAHGGKAMQAVLPKALKSAVLLASTWLQACGRACSHAQPPLPHSTLVPQAVACPSYALYMHMAGWHAACNQADKMANCLPLLRLCPEAHVTRWYIWSHK
jgi:hypothetical protein